MSNGIRNIAVAEILIDGVRCGTVTCGSADDVSETPLGEGFAFGPAPSPSAFPQRFASREYPGGGIDSGHQPTHGTQSRAAPHHTRISADRKLPAIGTLIRATVSMFPIRRSQISFHSAIFNRQ